MPGLTMLIPLAAFNNLLAGVFLALMDTYGLELVSVRAWGLLWGVISLAFIFGFAQLVKNLASPLTAFLVAPLAEADDDRRKGQRSDRRLVRYRPDRGIALMFTLAGLIGVVVTSIAWSSRSYRQLAASG